MWIGHIDVPQAVLDAADAGRLVIFVGAGASRAAPSDLPDFADLVRGIGTRTERIPTADEVMHPDVFLGRLGDSGIDVHHLVAAEIDRAGSRPNALHAAIVGLAASCPAARLVTTNYDRHLTSAAVAQGLSLKHYEGPALPLGDDFDGIVHLHGSLDQPTRRLVVTDSDFGNAYLREAWAARFLERMFSAFTVLFIGYSHGDVVMQYLARSLGPNESRFVLTEDAQNAEWRRLGVTPISYPNDSGDHSALPASLERWVEMATMGRVEHRARIADLVSGEPPSIPEEVSYIESALGDPERIRYFAEKARFEDADRRHRWFSWIEDRPPFSNLFNPQTSREPTAVVLMSWIAEQYILDESGTGVALRAFRNRVWPSDTWQVIAQSLLARKGEFPRWLSPWLQLVLQNAPRCKDDLLDLMLSEKDWSTNFELALLLLEDRTRPHLKPAMDFGGGLDAPRFEVDLCGDEYWLTENWTNIFLPVINDHLEDLLSLVSEQITRVYRSLDGLSSDRTFDPISFSRAAIERHEQDDHRDAIDALIDAARDGIEASVSGHPSIAKRFLGAWCRSSATILRRLAVHGWRIRADVHPDEKLTWVREENLLWDTPLQHEVYQLLRDTLPTASEEAARRLIEEAVAGPIGDEDDERSSRRCYNLLGWLADSAPDLTVASRAYEEAQKAHPQYRRREHPDLNHYGSVGFVEDALPFSAAEFHELVLHDPTEALARLREFDTETHALEGPTWTGALRSLQACITAYPEDGKRVAPVLQPQDTDIRASLIRGWGAATLQPGLIRQVLSLIAGWDPDEIRRPTCSMLSNGGGPEHPTPWHHIEQARQLASALWPPSEVSGGIIGGSDFLMEAINHPAGDLAKFWSKVAQWDWSQNEPRWGGIPDSVVAELDRLVRAANRNGLLARTFLASQLHFFFAADPDWCQSRLLPILDWAADREQTAAAWQGFLTWGRWNDALLQAGLLDGYLETAAHAEDLPKELLRQLAGHLTSIAMYAHVDPSTWLRRFVVAAPEELRVLWAKQVNFALTQLDPGQAPIQWERWIEAYWSERNHSVPLPYTCAEASATAGWVLGLDGVRSQAIDLVLGSGAGLGQGDRLLSRIADLDVSVGADDWARLVTHLLKNTKEPHWAVGYHLKAIVPQLRAADPSLDLSQLINEAMRLGAIDADDW